MSKARREAPTQRGGERGWATPEDGVGSPRVGDELSLCVGGCFQMGAKQKGADELVRLLCDAVRPKLYYA